MEDNDSEELDEKDSKSKKTAKPKVEMYSGSDDDDDFNKLSKKQRGKLRNQIRSVMHQKRMRITVKN